jgi:serine/threonine-protein kinase
VAAVNGDERDSKSARGVPAMLRINSRPWSQIFIDGKWIGNTPQLGIQLSAGNHSVRLVNSEFGMSKTFTVKLAAGEQVTRVETLTE